MATYANVPTQLIDIVQGVIFLFFAAERFLARYRQSLVVKTAREEIALKEAQKKEAQSKEGGKENG
jgi:simple sugar transport system permease protein